MEFYQFILGLAVSGAIALVGIILQINFSRRKKTCTEQTTGTIIGFDETTSFSYSNEHGNDDNRRFNRGQDTTHYYPICQYQAGGETVTNKSKFACRRSKFKTGQSVTIFYSPGDVNKYYIAEQSGTAKVGICVIAFGIIVAAILTAVFLSEY